jgi:hypothetical protein
MGRTGVWLGRRACYVNPSEQKSCVQACMLTPAKYPAGRPWHMGRRVRRENFAGGGSPAIFARRRRRAAQFCSAAAASEICRRRRRSAALVWRYSGQVIAVNVKISAHVVYI